MFQKRFQIVESSAEPSSVVGKCVEILVLLKTVKCSVEPSRIVGIIVENIAEDYLVVLVNYVQVMFKILLTIDEGTIN